MKHTLIAAGLACGTIAATPVNAATTLTYPTGQSVGLTASPDGTTLAGDFTGLVSGTGSFASSFIFTVPADGVVSIAGISIMAGPRSNIDFTSGLLDGVHAFTITNGFVDIAELSLQAISAGTHSFTLNGTLTPPSGTGNAGFGGNLSFVLAGAVPEPATWALFIVGFGAIGGMLRRRERHARVTRSTLSFA